MINKVIINHLKKFESQEFDIPPHLVVAGPNNSGKTTLLQAIGVWSEIAFQWLENNPDLARDENGNYPDTQLNLLRVYSIPLIDFEHLWKDKNVQKPASVWIYTDQWKIGFELNYKEMELIAIRPATDVTENDLEKYLEAPLFPVYIPPFSSIDIEEPLYGTPALSQQRLAQAKAGSVLRNLLVAVSKDSEKWELLQKAIHSFFGYQLDIPSVGAKILIRYRHSKQGQSYDLTSAASGFLQILMIYAVLLVKDEQVVLIDEPDAHLHLLLQGKLYHDLCEYSKKTVSN